MTARRTEMLLYFEASDLLMRHIVMTSAEREVCKRRRRER
jgi:hypothetical protein